MPGVHWPRSRTTSPAERSVAGTRGELHFAQASDRGSARCRGRRVEALRESVVGKLGAKLERLGGAGPGALGAAGAVAAMETGTAAETATVSETATVTRIAHAHDYEDEHRDVDGGGGAFSKLSRLTALRERM